MEADYNSRMVRRAIYRWGNDYVLLFDHVLSTAFRSQWVGRRKLYLSLDGNMMRIFGDTYQSVPRGNHDPLLQAWQLFRPGEEKDSQVAANEKNGQRNYSLE